MFLHGTYKHQLDAKFRLRLPAKLRAAFGGDFVVMHGMNGCLYVFGQEYFDACIGAKINAVPNFKQEYQHALRVLTELDIPEEDAQGRFVLPSELREFAGITKNIVVRGVGQRAEIWDEERWELHKKGKLDFSAENKAFDEAMKKLEEFNI